MKRMIFSFMFFLLATGAMAQTPAMFNFQGQARNSDGSIISNQQIKVRFSILDSSATGVEIYKESDNVTTDEYGLFNVMVGGPNAHILTGSIASINWSHNSKFLKLFIDPTNGNHFITMGTTQLLSVPYAEQSRKTDSSNYAINTASLKTYLTDANSFTSDNISGGTTSVVSYNSTSFSDPNFNNTTHEYTVPSSGNYLVNFNISLLQFSGGGKANGQAVVRVNGSNTFYTMQFVYPQNSDNISHYYPLTGTYAHYFTAGQKITIAVTNNGSGSDASAPFSVTGINLNIFKIGNR